MSKYIEGEMVWFNQLNAKHEKTGCRVKVRFLNYNGKRNRFGERTADIVGKSNVIMAAELRELEAIT